MEKKIEEKIMTFIVATNVVASRPPEHRPTGTPHARANKITFIMYTSFRMKMILKMKMTPNNEDYVKLEDSLKKIRGVLKRKTISK